MTSSPSFAVKEKNVRHFDVAIIGGGPAGSTVACLLKKYNPSLSVAVLERETFPRDHIGESLLPPISPILAEMGCWDKIEAANFPIKAGATYRWGKTPELWNFEFVPADKFEDQPRPAKLEGQRLLTAFQVDRSIYDKILLDHAAEMGCDVLQGTQVTKVGTEGDAVTHLELSNGESVSARYYIDASGNSGILRRAFDVTCDYPSTLKNIAIYDYWQNAEWAVKIGVGGTRIQVLSLGYGWIWFIPLGPTRTSIGLVVPAEYYKRSGLTPGEIYRRALGEESIVAGLIQKAEPEGKLQTTRDWSFLADRQAGENWFLVGESAGFADPILSAGVSMAHLGAQQLAYTILELDRGKLDTGWLKEQFEMRQKQRIRTHIRFGDFWYTANSQLTELKQFTSQLADDLGLVLSPEKAWEWIASGGFIDEDLAIGTGGFGLGALRNSSQFLAELKTDSLLDSSNVLTLDLAGSTIKHAAAYVNGGVIKFACYIRGDRVLPLRGLIKFLVDILQHEKRFPFIMSFLEGQARKNPRDPRFSTLPSAAPEALDAMIRDGWIQTSYDERLPLGKMVQEASAFQWQIGRN